MVQAKTVKGSAIRDCLGPSTWFDVVGSANDKWCPEEGEKLLELILRLEVNDVPPDLYIITPFVIVAEEIRKAIKESKILQRWKIEKDYIWLKERIGTVHTVQGREAEAVFFILGAPLIDQISARSWASDKPNILNVAVTRAKEAFYVIGNKTLWKETGVFSELADRIGN